MKIKNFLNMLTITVLIGIVMYIVFSGLPRLISSKSDWTVGLGIFIILLTITNASYYAWNKLTQKEK